MDKATHKRADSFRQYLETEKLEKERLIESFCFTAGKKICAFLEKEAKCTNPKVLEYSSDLTADDNNNLKLTGKITFKVTAFHDTGDKTVEIPVDVKNDEVVLPDTKVVESVLNTEKSFQILQSLKIKEEINSNIQKIIKNEEDKVINFENEIKQAELVKTAASVAAPGSQLHDVLKINKANLPSGLKVGDVVFTGDAKYRIASGDENKLNAEGTGVMWTMERIWSTTDADIESVNIKNKF